MNWRYSTKKLAKIAGILYLIVIVTGLFAELFVRQSIRISDDALATAQNIQFYDLLFRCGFVADLINFVVGLPLVILIYHLFKKINKNLVRLAVVFVIIQTAIIAMNLLFQMIPLLLLSNDSYLSTFRTDQLASLSLLSLNIQTLGYGVGLIFFGFYCLIIGYLIFKSAMMPRIIGILYAFSGLCYLINSFTMLFSENFETPLFIYLSIPIFVGELSFCLWLLFVGVKKPT